MRESSDSQTSLSLLNRLRHAPTDEAAWGEFVQRYGPRILGWCRRWRLQEADASDVTQAVLMKMVGNIDRFDAERGRFRAWLKTIAHHAWYDLVTSRGHKLKKGGDTLSEQLESEEARDDLATQLEAAWDHELLQIASARVRLRVKPATWSAFEQTAVLRRSGQDVADELSLSVASVYKARSNVTKMLEEEVAKLEEPGSA